MTNAENDALRIMETAVAAFRAQMVTPRYARDRRDEVKDCAKLFMTGLQAVVSEAEGDPEYIDIKAILGDIDAAFSDIIETEEGQAVPHYAARLQRQYGTYHVRGGRVA